jgi:hypothetical protein
MEITMKNIIKKFQFNTAFIKQTITFLFFSLTLTACQTPPLDVYHSMNNDVDLSQYQTFSIQAITDSDSPFINYLNRGIINTFIKKGYQLSEESDLVIRYSLEVQSGETVKINSIPVQGNIYTQTSMEAVFEAKMLANIIDRASERVIWKAATSRDIRGINAKHINQAKVNERMAELFDSF